MANDDRLDLPELEREVLAAVAIGGPRSGVATDCVDEELLERSPGLTTVVAVLRRLEARGLLRSERSWGFLTVRPRDGIHVLSEVHNRKTLHREYEGDWWIITEAGRVALGSEAR